MSGDTGESCIQRKLRVSLEMGAQQAGADEWGTACFVRGMWKSNNLAKKSCGRRLRRKREGCEKGLMGWGKFS